MRTVRVRDLTIGEGVPKICVSIVGKTREEIIESAKSLKNIPKDLAEWRADWYEHINDMDQCRHMLQVIREEIGETPLLFTFRTKEEGGEKSIEPEEYVKLNQEAARSGCADLVDVEIFLGDKYVTEIIQSAHANGAFIVGSNHDFHKTPPKEELVRRLCKMQEMGADIAKIAVMPREKADVLVLLAATLEASEKHLDRPVISMSMTGTGLISRLAGESFGSSVTFGAAGKASAPGQMDAAKLHEILTGIHESL